MDKRCKDKSGTRLGRLLIKDYAGQRPYGKNKKTSYWRCLCDCGREVDIPSTKLTPSGVKSCGCYQGKPKHGHSGTQEYKCWKSMKSRCLNPNHKDYERYSFKGILIEPSWVNSFDNFIGHIGWMPDNESTYTVDRIDGSKGYIEGNIRWATRTEQSRNRKKFSNNLSGKTGVSKRVRGDKISYQANWRNLDGIQESKEFSADKYGDEQAKLMAEEARGRAIKALNEEGAGYSTLHGK